MRFAMDNKALVKHIFTEMFKHEAFDHAFVSEYFHPDYIQDFDGKTLNYCQFIEHMKVKKASLKHVKIEFDQLVAEKDTVCSIHYAHVIKADGSKVKTKVIACFTIKDNKLFSCDELTHLLVGDQEDRDLGSRH
jgi:ketosteroid isomerase-like protein